MSRYILGTNTVSHLLKQHPVVARRVQAAPMASLCVSAITAGELLCGLAKRPHVTRLGLIVTGVSATYRCAALGQTPSRDIIGTVCAAMEHQGRILAPLDLLIAAHALGIGAVLVTNN